MVHRFDQFIRVLPLTDHAHAFGDLIEGGRQRDFDLRVIEESARNAQLIDGRRSPLVERPLDTPTSIPIRQIGEAESVNGPEIETGEYPHQANRTYVQATHTPS